MRKIILLATFAIFCFSCSNLTSEIKDLGALQKAIEKQFDFKEVNFKIVNNKSLDVSVINSSYNDSSDDAKQRVADAIGAASAEFMQQAKLTEGTVSFVHNNNVGLVNVSKGNSFPMHLNK